MIKVYSANERLFDNNGLFIMHPTKAEIFIEDNGDYYIEIETSIDDLDYVQEGMIVRANTRWGEQGFRLTNPKKKNNKLYAKGYHLYKDTSKYVIVDSYVDNKDCNDALDHINNACESVTPFTTISDISTINSARIIRKSLEEAIGILVEKYNGHLYRNNWTIGIMDEIGSDRGVVIKYGKNSTNIEATENWDNVVTKLLPVGYDGITLPEKFLISDVQYDVPYTKVVKFDQDISEEDFKDESGEVDREAYTEALLSDLRRQATDYLNENKILKCNYKVKANIEGVIDLGDTITVEHERLGINITTNVISLKYDCIRDKYIEAEFGNFKYELKSLISTIESNTREQVISGNETVKVKLESELTEWLNIDDNKILEFSQQIFGNEDGTNSGFHDARFDTTAMYVACIVYGDRVNNTNTWINRFCKL